MEIFLYFCILFFVTYMAIHFYLSFLKLTTIQRIKLLETYSNLFLMLKLNYKNEKESALFQSKEDFFYFKNAFSWLQPYIRGSRKWSELSNWDIGMSIQHFIEAENKYPSSNVSKFIEKYLFEIALRSVVLLFPRRINLFIHFKNNEENKFMVGSLDLTMVKEEIMKENKISKITDFSEETILQKSTITQIQNNIEILKIFNNGVSFWRFLKIISSK